MKTKKKLITICFFLISLTSACGAGRSPSRTPTSVVTTSPVPVTQQLAPSSTFVPAPLLTTTASVTQTPALPVFNATRLPELGNIITSINAKNIVEMARWGKGNLYKVTYSPDGRLIAVASSIGIYVYDSKNLKQSLYIDTGVQNNDVAFSPDGKMLVAGSGNNTVKLWDVATGSELRTFRGHKGAIVSVAFSPDGKIVASGSDDNTAKLWDTTNGAEIHTLSGSISSLISVAFSPDGKTLASASKFKTVNLWDVASGREIYTLNVDTYYVYSVAFSPDGKTLASVSDEGA